MKEKEQLRQDLIKALGGCSSIKFWGAIKDIFEEAELAERADKILENMSRDELKELHEKHFE